MSDIAKRNLVAQWAFDTRPVLLRFHLWLEDVEVERAQAEPVSAHSFAPRGIARCLAMTAAATALGTRLFGDYVTATFDLARRFAGRVRAASDFELAVEPEANIVCFRLTPPGAGDLDALQLCVRARLLADGSFYIVQTRLPAGQFLRVTIINPFTTDDDLAALLDAVRAGGRLIP